MIMDAIVGDSVGKGMYISVVPVGQDPHSLWPQDAREKICRPEHPLVLGSPCVVGMTVETMDKDDIDIGALTGAIDLRQTYLVDGVRVNHDGEGLWGREGAREAEAGRRVSSFIEVTGMLVP